MRKRFVCVLILIFAILNVAAIFSVHWVEHGRSQEDIAALLQSIGDDFDKQTAGYEHSFQLFSRMMQEKLKNDPSPEELRAYLRQLDDDLMGIEGAYYDGLYMVYQGNYYFSWDADPSEYTPEKGYIYSERPWYQGAVAAQGALSWTSPYRSYLNDYVLMTVSCLQPDGETVFAYDVHIDAPTFQKKLAEVAGAQVYVIDQNGIIVTGTDTRYSGISFHDTPEELRVKEENYRQQAQAQTGKKNLDALAQADALHAYNTLREELGDAVYEMNEHPNTLIYGHAGGYFQVISATVRDGYSVVLFYPFMALIRSALMRWIGLLIIFEVLFVLLLFLAYKAYKNSQLRETRIRLSNQERIMMAVGKAYSGIFLVDLNKDTEATAFQSSDKFNGILHDCQNSFLAAMRRFGETYVNEEFRQAYTENTERDAVKGKILAGITPQVMFSEPDGTWMELRVYPANGYSEATPYTVWIFELASAQAVILRNRSIMSRITDNISFVLLVNLKTGEMQEVQAQAKDKIPSCGTSYLDFSEMLGQKYATQQSESCYRELTNIDGLRQKMRARDVYMLPAVQVKDGRWFQMNLMRSRYYSEEFPEVILTINDVTDSQNKALEIHRMEDEVERLENQQKINKELLETLSAIVEFRDVESGEHIQRIKGYTRILANKVREKYPDYRLTPEDVEMIVSASAMHDVGKIAVPDHILLKPGRLTPEEFEIMKTHAEKGGEIVQMLDRMQDARTAQYCYEIARYHHERWDGRGYPEGLCGNAIPIAAQIVGVADVYDALVSKRCYKDAYSLSEAMEMIMGGKCGMFNPQLLGCLALAKNEFESFALHKIVPIGGAVTPSEEIADFKGYRILVADDMKVEARILQKCVTATGAQCEIAYNGRELVDLVERNAVGYYDLILTDLRMPVMNGHEAAKAVRAMGREDSVNLPIIALSAEAYAETVSVYEDHAINMVLSKPVAPRELYLCMGGFLHGRRKQ